jgi:putative transposase
MAMLISPRAGAWSKAVFSHASPRVERISASRAAKGERGIWERRHWEDALRDEDDFVRYLDYIHFNPVKHGHAVRVRDWPFPSFRRWPRLGAYPVARRPRWGTLAPS